MRTILFLSAFLMVLASCQSKQEIDPVTSVNDLGKVDFKDEKNVLIDVRTPEEFSEGHIANAINLDVNNENFESEIQKMDTSKTYYVYCQAGVRSSKATSKLLRNGFKNIVNLKDGYKNYHPN